MDRVLSRDPVDIEVPALPSREKKHHARDGDPHRQAGETTTTTLISLHPLPKGAVLQQRRVSEATLDPGWYFRLDAGEPVEETDALWGRCGVPSPSSEAGQNPAL